MSSVETRLCEAVSDVRRGQINSGTICDLDPLNVVAEGVFVVTNCWREQTNTISRVINYLDAKTGRPQWSLKISDWGYGLCPNSAFCTLAVDGQMVALTTGNGKEVSTWQSKTNSLTQGRDR